MNFQEIKCTIFLYENEKKINRKFWYEVKHLHCHEKFNKMFKHERNVPKNSCNSPFSSCGMSSVLLEPFRLFSFEQSVSPLVSLQLSSSFTLDLSGTWSTCPEYIKELPNRLICVNSEGVVSKRAATDVRVSRSFTAYGIVGIGVTEPNKLIH